MLKKIVAGIVVLFLLFGCATRYTIPPDRVNYHDADREQCRLENPRGGTFLFGPIIIILPLFIGLVAASYAAQAAKVDNCMVAKGYPLEVEKETAPTGKRDGLLDSHPNTAVMPYHGNDDAGHREIGRDGRFIAYADETVLDTKINLMWAARDNGSDINWADAKSYCVNYSGGGYTDWRLPTQDELAGLYARGAHKDKVLITGWVWASETSGSVAPGFDFDGGKKGLTHQSGDAGLRALPVRSAE